MTDDLSGTDEPLAASLAQSISHLRAALKIVDDIDLPILGTKISEALDFALREIEELRVKGDSLSPDSSPPG